MLLPPCKSVFIRGQFLGLTNLHPAFRPANLRQVLLKIFPPEARP